jgi:hypothetical protein
MATDHPMGSSPDDPRNEDRRTQRAVLAFLLDQFPTRLMRSELPFALDAKDFAEKDAVARAVRELISAGLLDVLGDSVSPSRAALYFEWLEGSR